MAREQCVPGATWGRFAGRPGQPLICRPLGNCTVWINKKKKCFLALTECPLVESSARDVAMTAAGGRQPTRHTQAVPVDGVPSQGKFQNPTPSSTKPQWKQGRNEEVPAKRIWEAKVLAPTRKADSQVKSRLSETPTKAACHWIAEKTGWWPVV